MGYAIASGHIATTQAAEEVLRAGGNAVDAAIAAFTVAWVAEPCMASAGGGGFAITRVNGDPVQLFDFFCQTPRIKKPAEESDFFPIVVDFGATRETFHVGLGATAVPGAIAGVFALHERYGRMPIRELLQPAIEAAAHGVEINRFQYEGARLLESILRLHPRGRTLFLRNDRLAAVGDRLHFPQMADYLDHLGREGRDAFYRGEVARKIAADHESGGGYLHLADLEAYRVIVREPLAFTYRGLRFYTNPLPSTGGTRLTLGLKKLEEREALPPLHSGEQVRSLYGVFRYLETIGFQAADLARAMEVVPLSDHLPKWGSTTHISVVDNWGNAVGLTATNGEGSGYFVEGTDIQLNNMLGEAALQPLGFHSWQPDTRLSSLMAPTIWLDAEGNFQGVTGSSGAGRIPNALLQVVHYLVDHGLEVQAAVDRPRVHGQEGVLYLEPGLELSGWDGAVERFDAPSLFFGGAHTVVRQAGRLFAAADRRREGLGVAG